MNRIAAVRRGQAIALAVMMTVALLGLRASPAAADETPPPGEAAGSGRLAGTERVLEEEFTGSICFRTFKTIFALRGVGTYHGRTAGGQDVVYRAAINTGETLYGDGPLQVEVENIETYYSGPFGTHGTSDASCAPATANTPIAAEFRIFAADHVYTLDGGTQVPCTGRGSFARTAMNDEPNWHAEWSLDADCTVVGNDSGTPGSGVSPANTTLTHDGIHQPCFSAPCSDNIRVDYAQYLPFQGLHVGMGGPASAQVGDPVAVIAAVTNDSQPVPNAAVTFSVAGPAPGSPPGGAAVTGADGRASFTFTAAVAGPYTVSASVTNGTNTASGTHAVHFTPPAPPTMTLDGPTKAQTEEAVTVTATFTNAGNPVPATNVDFAVAGPGQATPASGSALTDADGKAVFTFAGDRRGDYTVTASATLAGQEASATHGVHLDINTFQLAGSLAVNQPASSLGLRAAVVDPAGDYAYFAGGRQIDKVDLRTFQTVDAITVPNADGSLVSAVIDPAGDYAYFGTNKSPARVVKVDLRSFQQVGSITLKKDDDLGIEEANLTSAVVDSDGHYGYFGTYNAVPGPPQRVVKVDLVAFQRVDAIVLPAEESGLQSAVMDPSGRFAYFGAKGVSANPGRMVRIDLATFQRVGAVTLNGLAENELTSAVIDPDGRFAYFGTTPVSTATPGRVVKVDLDTLQRVGAVILNRDEQDVTSAVIDTDGTHAYFGAARFGPKATGGTQLIPPIVVKVDLTTFERAAAVAIPPGEEGYLTSAVIDPDSAFAYFGKQQYSTTNPPGTDSPAQVFKVAVSRPPNAALAAAPDSYATPYATPLAVPAPGVLANDVDTGDGDPLTAGQASDPAGGSVALNPDGSFAYTPDAGFSGTDTFTYTASDAMDYSAPATVSVTVAAPPEGVQAVSGGAFGFLTDVSMFGGPMAERGPAPSVTVPAGGGTRSATDPDGDAGVYGPAHIFENHGPLTVQTTGTTGAGGSVTSSSSVHDISDNDPFHAHGPDGQASSTCRADEAGLSGSSRIVNGRLVVHTDPETGDPTEQITFPHDWSPAPNTVYEGGLDHVGDRWRIVFNEQVRGPDSITVNALHLYLLGSAAVGEMVIGQSRCGVELATANAAPAATDDAYTAVSGRPLSVAAPGLVANDTDADAQPLSAGPVAATFTPDPPPSGGGTWAFPSDPAHGTLALGHDGSFTYTPDPGFTGTDTFAYVVSDSRGASDQGSVTITVEPAPEGQPPVADFDGDADTDISVFRPSTGIWFVQGGQTTAWGTSGDVAVPADYDGDATTDLAVFRPSLGLWFVKASGGGESALAWGTDGDLPVPGDYDGDGRADVAVFRPSSGTWFLKATTAGESATAWGTDGDVAVPADYDGDGRTDPAVFRPSLGVWFVNASGAGASAVAWGTHGDIPVPGDYDGDGRADMAVFRPSAGVWFVQASTAGASSIPWGVSGDVPVPGDYDGDGRAEVAVFRPSTGVWFVNGGVTTFWGTDGDVALPLPAAVREMLFSSG